MESDRITWEGGLGPMDQDSIANRNVEQLDFTGKHLGNLPRARSLPGSRSDGGMAPMVERPINSLLDQILQNDKQIRQQLAEANEHIAKQEAELLRYETDLISLRSDLETEKKQKDHYHDMLRKIAELVVNGAKDRP